MYVWGDQQACYISSHFPTRDQQKETKQMKNLPSSDLLLQVKRKKTSRVINWEENRKGMIEGIPGTVQRWLISEL